MFITWVLKMKERVVFTTDARVITAVIRNGFGDPIGEVEGNGAWVYAFGLEQFLESLQREHDDHAA